MTSLDEEAARVDDNGGRLFRQGPQAWVGLLGWLVRAVARLWVVSLLLCAAAFGGIAVNQLLLTQAELNELRQAPGADAYAVVAYRRELARQIRLYNRSWRADSVPSPPQRPRLLEDIDLARQRNQELVRISEGPAEVSAPP